MGPLQLFLPFVIFSEILISPTTPTPTPTPTTNESQCNSNSATCSSKKEPLIQFPFRLHTLQHQTCGYPGFTLSCNSRSKTVLDVATSGEFFVRDIDYVSQEIKIYDPDNCLPRRFISSPLNLSNTPFETTLTRNYTFLNCTTSASDPTAGGVRLSTIKCLSSENHEVLGTYSRSLARAMVIGGGCVAMKTVPVPVSVGRYSQIIGEVSAKVELEDDVHLSWANPDCRECVERGGKCGLVSSNNSSEIQCFGAQRKGLSRAMRYLLTLGVGVPALMCAIGMACYVCARVSANSARHPYSSRRAVEPSSMSTVSPQPTILMAGLDELTIESYPKTVLGESRRLPKPDENSCPICLSEYRPKETLKTIPDCGHIFHAECIDEWLRINASCPLCRNSPAAQSPQNDVV
ncbi:hypothetical protein Sjap_005347 [Stephania japonica]|uniref:RING-type E3 ubiquitin transferase n=1 Tax=Stephania japonica TaxID=461633 RepID=A0AAP0K5G4_9MAGN